MQLIIEHKTRYLIALLPYIILYNKKYFKSK